MAKDNLSIDLGKVAIAPKGEYSATVTYERLDLVKANNSAYVSITDENIGHPVTDTTWWMCVVDGSEAKAQAQAAREATENALQMANAANTAAGNANTQAARASAAQQAAETATASVTKATEKANDAAGRCEEVIEAASKVEQFGILPTRLEVEYPAEITFGNVAELFVKGILYPEYVLSNIIYQGDNQAVAIAPDGRISILKEGTSTIYVIPTGNTQLFKTIQIKVHTAGLRMVDNRTTIRLTAKNELRLN